MNPFTDGYAKRTWLKENDYTSDNWTYSFSTKKLKVRDNEQIYYIPNDVLMQTTINEYYSKNCFINNLLYNIRYPFPSEMIQKVIELYFLGTIHGGYFDGAITFPFIDNNKKIRAIQAKLFDTNNHTTKTNFLHKLLRYPKNDVPNWLQNYKKNDKKVTCLFGEHLLSKYKDNPIALVEAPKTAVYGTLYFGDPSNANNFLWLAVYNQSSLNYEKCKHLNNRKIVLFPDLSKNSIAFESWKHKGLEIEQKLNGSKIITSDLLEKNATTTDREKGLDLADYLIKQDWRLFRKKELPKSEPLVPLTREKSEKSEPSKKTIFSHNKIQNIISKYPMDLNPDTIEFLNGEYLNSNKKLLNLIDEDLLKVLNRF